MRKTIHEGITPPSFCYPHGVQAPKGARGAGQVCRRHRITHPSLLPTRRASPEPAGFCYPHGMQALKPAEFCYSHGVQAPKPAGFCYPHGMQALKPAEFCYPHGVQSPKPAGFCYSHAVQALKPAEFCYSHAVQALKPAGFCYPHAVQALKGARGAGQVCGRHRITHPSMLPARSVSTENQATPLTAARRTREFSCGAGTRTWLGYGRRGL